jgi:ubiquinone/menaquinone biosynthesis C-methylase UbiE
MDFNDYQAGLSKDYFWFQGKREFIKILLEKNNLPQNCKILNIGAGTGEDLNIINKFGNVYAIDINQDALNLISSELVKEKKIMDVCTMGYEDNSFDAVLAFDVLEHIENDQRAVREIRRVLKKDTGVFIFTVPAFNFLFSTHDKNLGHFRRYSKKGLKKLFADFHFVSSGYWFFTLFLPIAIQRLLSSKSSANLPSFINKMFFKLLNFENFLISKKIKFPYGLTLYGVCKTKK